MTVSAISAPPSDSRTSTGEAPADHPPTAPRNMAFVGWAAAIFVLGSILMLLVCRHVTGGRIVYVIDDAAIHLSLARTLLHHATWGVQGGNYQSVSSSPLWGALLAAAMWLTRTSNVVPWVLNVFSGLWLLWAIGSRQQALSPSRRAPLAVVATAGLVSVALFMPSLTMVGMEHLLHAAVVVQLLAWMHDRSTGRPSRIPAWAPYVLTVLAVLTRFESLWVVAGIGLGYLIDGWLANPDRGSEVAARARVVAGLLVAAGAPLAAYSAINRAMGQGFLPNSIVAKTASSNSARFKITPQLIINQLAADPLVAMLLLAAIAYLTLAVPKGVRRTIVPAVTVVVSVVAHSVFAQYGNFERYQAYLIALGIYFALSAASEVLPDRHTAVAVLALAALVVVPVKWTLVVLTPRGSDDTFAQRYQAALFVQRYYDGQSIATGELGYISLHHRGPLTDVLGLGDYDVLQHRRHRRDTEAYYSALARRAGVQMAVVYKCSLGARTPASWFLAGQWNLNGPAVSTVPEPYQFWATSPSGALRLRAHLTEYAAHLPPHVKQSLNLSLEAQIAARAGGNPGVQCPRDRL